MITEHIPILRDFQKWVTSKGSDSLTMFLLVTAFLLAIAAFSLPASAKGVILGWVLFP